MKQHAPATARNQDPILEVLVRVLPPSGVVLELASGTGEHAVHFARGLPHLAWQPTDPDATARASIAAWRADSALANLDTPLPLDAASLAWPLAHADAIVCINMIHISPWEATLGLFAGARRTLPVGGVLVTYGPYRFAGETAPSNEAFDRSLRQRDPRWGLRDVEELRVAAVAHEMHLVETIAMPANNHALIYLHRRS
ncbi:MAG: DUF938 domain-containing protein [Proteobacteria bacterium]|nr:DUF938 domain-containing protein [Pseudomonadota bacterium]